MTREKRIIRASWWAVSINALLAAMKLSVGFISGSYAVIADGIDSATDIATSLVVLLAARIINKPPNITFCLWLPESRYSCCEDTLLRDLFCRCTTCLVVGSGAFTGGGDGNTILSGHLGNSGLHFRQALTHCPASADRKKGREPDAHCQCAQHA